MAGRGRKRRGADNGFADWGGYMHAKISKLENQYLASAANKDDLEGGNNNTSRLFEGVAIFVNGYTVPTAEELKRLMMIHGGIFHHYYNSSTTTHIIATNLPDTKVKQLKGNEKIVKPTWIVDSMKEGKLLDFRPYLLYTQSMEKGQQKLQLPTVNKKPLGTTIPPKPINDSEPGTSKEDDFSSIDNKRHLRAGEDNFLSEFYNRSRLHHISTMGAMFKRYVSELRDKHAKSGEIFQGIENLKKWKREKNINEVFKEKENVIMHIDMDCFFVSVGLRKHPELRGQPVVVTHARADSKPQARKGSNREFEFDCYKEHWIKKHDGTTEEIEALFPRLENLDESCSMAEIASCSYEARAAGIYNGMFLGAALKLCPNLKTIQYDFEGYKEVSFALYDTIASYTLEIEAVSCDEMYVNITSLLKDAGASPEAFATHIREVIFNKTGCTASVGMGPSLLMARLATKKAKPNGFFRIPLSKTGEYMKEQKVDDLPGVGRSIAFRLHAMGCQTCDDMQKVPLSRLQQEFGPKQGQTLFNMCRGEDQRELKTGHVRKSVSAEVNYGIRFTNDQEVYKFTLELCEEVCKRMEEAHVKGRLLTLKIKIRSKDAPVETAKFMGHGLCDSFSKSSTFPVATRDPSIIHKEVMSLLRQLKVDSSDLRGMGVQLSKLDAETGKGKQLAANSILSFMSRKTEKMETANERKEQIQRCPAGVDPAVFSELPKEIQDDIIESYKPRGDQVHFKNVLVDESSCDSHSSAIDNLKSTDDIDPEYWSALPEDIKAEIRREIERKKMLKVSPKKGITAGNALSALKWPAAKSDDRKSPRKKRGRPSKSQGPQTKRKTNAKQKQIFQQPKKPEKVTPPLNDAKASTSNQVVSKQEETAASLGESKTPNEVCALWKKWIESCEEPLDEDIHSATEYLTKLVHQRNLENVLSLLRTFKRLTQSRNPVWILAAETLVNEVQVHVIEQYNAPLKL